MKLDQEEARMLKIARRIDLELTVEVKEAPQRD